MSSGLFDVGEVIKAAEKLDLSDRGSDEGYNLATIRELYLLGRINVHEFVSAILNSEDGDTRRRDIMARARQTAAERMLRKAGDKNGWTEPTGT